MTMDERRWSKARNLASAYSEAYDENVALVLGHALLEVLAELLVPEDEKAEAKAQHPAYLSARENQCADQYINYFCTNDEGHDGAHHSFGLDGSSATWREGINPSLARGVKVLVTVCEFCGGHDHQSRCGYCNGHHPGDPIHEEEAGYLPHPEFLEGEAAYKAAPVGTLVRERETTPVWQHTAAGGWRSPSRTHDVTQSPAPWAKRSVIRWGMGTPS